MKNQIIKKKVKKNPLFLPFFGSLANCKLFLICSSFLSAFFFIQFSSYVFFQRFLLLTEARHDTFSLDLPPTFLDDAGCGRHSGSEFLDLFSWL